MSKHTPEPWEANFAYHGYTIEIGPKAYDGLIATVWDETYSDENKANARLIAAAPDLLEALKKARQGYANLIELGILPHTAWDTEGKLYIDEMDAAIAKATGEDDIV